MFPIHWITEYEMADVDAMLQFIESRPSLRTLPLLTCGVSRGGVAALVAACDILEFAESLLTVRLARCQ